MSKSELKRFHEATASCLNPQSAPANTSEHARAYKEAFASIMPVKETVNHPDHYNEGIETIDYIESWEMDFSQGNVIKYVSRYKSKGGLEDLKKAQWYLERLIQKEEKNV